MRIIRLSSANSSTSYALFEITFKTFHGPSQLGYQISREFDLSYP